MTTPAAAARTGGRTSQGRGPAATKYVQSGRIQGGASPPARTRTAKPKPATAAQIKASQRQSAAAHRSQQRFQAPPRSQQKRVAGQAARTSRTAGLRGATDYQKVIAAEFVLAELLVAATPFATKKDQQGLSPYVPRDMTKMLALGFLYFLLELLAIPAGSARFAAWFGGLILIVVGLNEAANITKDIDLFAGINPKSAGGGSALGP